MYKIIFKTHIEKQVLPIIRKKQWGYLVLMLKPIIQD
jgi:hypothetical protein